MNIRLYHPNSILENSTSLLSKEHTHYVVNVMRLKRGSNINFFNKDGEWKSEVIFLDKERVEVKLEWKSVGGLPTKGSVRFYNEESSKTVVKLKISYELPQVLANLMKANILGGMVTKELQKNLDGFKELVEKSA